MTGLRERKKRETRDASSKAAVQLPLERGLDNVRVEDIAEAAGVSPRTFDNYSSTARDREVALSGYHAPSSARATRPRLRSGSPVSRRSG